MFLPVDAYRINPPGKSNPGQFCSIKPLTIIIKSNAIAPFDDLLTTRDADSQILWRCY